jgi:hypothetical protein
MSIVAGGWINVPIAVNCSCAEVLGVKKVKVCGWICILTSFWSCPQLGRLNAATTATSAPKTSPM